ncbi:MAG: hypothetical protein WCT41_00400 [Candidatus Paceibacterota bacterium]|jgi:hypothetical protein
MNILIAVLGLFAIDYYGLRSYLSQRGKPTEGLTKNILLAYKDTAACGIAVLLISLPFFLVDTGAPRPYAELLSMALWGAGFVLPLPFFIKKRVNIPWLTAIGFIFGPLVFILPALYATF